MGFFQPQTLDQTETTGLLMQRYSGMVLGVCNRVLRNSNLAEDAAQATFLVLLRTTPIGIKNLDAWVYSIAYKTALFTRRGEENRRKRESTYGQQSLRQQTIDPFWNKEDAALLDEELHRLGSIYRLPIILCFFQGQSQSEAATNLGLPIGTVSNRIARGKAILKARLLRRGLSAATVATLLLPVTTTGSQAITSGLTANVPSHITHIAESMVLNMKLKKWTMILTSCFLLGTMLLTGYWLSQGKAQPQEKEKPPVAVVEESMKPFQGTWRYLGMIHRDGVKNMLVDEVRTYLRIEKDIVYMLKEKGPGDLAEMKYLRYRKHADAKSADKWDFRFREPNGTLPEDYNDKVFPGIMRTEGELLFVNFHAEGQKNVETLSITNGGYISVYLKETNLKAMNDPVQQHYRTVESNFRKILIAMHNYHSDYNRFPQYAHFDAKGKPLLSWRVMLLPYLEADHLYKQFRMNEPWDSPHNMNQLAKMPMVYQHPGSKAHEQLKTHYQVLLSPKAAPAGKTSKFLTPFSLDPNFKLTLNQMTVADGTSNTLLLVEAHDPVPWTKPEDITLEHDESPLPTLGAGIAPKFFVAGYADGSARFIAQTLPDKKQWDKLIRQLIGYNDGQNEDTTPLDVKP